MFLESPLNLRMQSSIDSYLTQLLNKLLPYVLLQMWADYSQLSFTEVSNCRESVIQIKFAAGKEENLLFIHIDTQTCPVRM